MSSEVVCWFWVTVVMYCVFNQVLTGLLISVNEENLYITLLFVAGGRRLVEILAKSS